MFNGIHSISFWDEEAQTSEMGLKGRHRNTWNNWRLIPTTRPVFASPDVKTSYLDIPGGNGSLDLSEALSGHPVYGDRKGSFTFVHAEPFDQELWYSWYNDMVAFLHGRRLYASIPGDSNYYYTGRFSVEGRADANYSTVTINYVVDPIKRELYPKHITLNVSGQGIATILGSPAPISPIITVSDDMTVIHNYTNTYQLKAGENYLPGLVFVPEYNYLVFTGNGSVVIDYHGGAL